MSFPKSKAQYKYLSRKKVAFGLNPQAVQKKSAISKFQDKNITCGNWVKANRRIFNLSADEAVVFSSFQVLKIVEWPTLNKNIKINVRNDDKIFFRSRADGGTNLHQITIELCVPIKLKRVFET